MLLDKLKSYDKKRNREVIAGWENTKKTMTVLSTISVPMVAEQQVVLLRSPAPTDLLCVPGGKKHFTSPDICNFEIGKTDRLLQSGQVVG